ncbi:MAG: TonB-dependent receptor plug domain-containing protein, partial [Gemmatimonadales bacterium]
MHSSITKIVALAAAFAVGASSAYAQRTNGESSRDTTSVVRMAPITITATRSEISTFRAPQPVQVVTRDRIAERLPNNVAELFREMPGIDMMGVGPNQGRPSIRGQRGQRILVLADGLRLNNSRRQQDFGELPGLVDVGHIERVEVVRG